MNKKCCNSQRYCCSQNYCCPTRYDDDCCNAVRQHRSCCDYFPRSPGTPQRRCTTPKKTPLPTPTATPAPTPSESFEVREPKRKAPKSRTTGTSKGPKAKRHSAMLSKLRLPPPDDVGCADTGQCPLPKVSSATSSKRSESVGCCTDNCDNSFLSRSSEAFDFRPTPGSTCISTATSLASKSTAKGKPNQQRMEVIDEEQEEPPDVSESDNQKKIQDSCVDFLSIVHDTVLETVQKSVDAILRDYFVSSMDKIDCLCSQMMRNECLLSKMYLDIIDRISQQSEKNLRQFRCLCHFLTENRRNEQQRQRQKCTCSNGSHEERNGRENARSRDESQHSYSAGSSRPESRYEMHGSQHFEPHMSHMSRNASYSNNQSKMGSEMRPARSSLRAESRPQMRSTCRMSCCKLPLPLSSHSTLRGSHHCTGTARNEAGACRHMGTGGSSATTIEEEIRKFTQLSTDNESTSATVIPLETSSEPTSRYTNQSRASETDDMKRPHISRL